MTCSLSVNIDRVFKPLRPCFATLSTRLFVFAGKRPRKPQIRQSGLHAQTVRRTLTSLRHLHETPCSCSPRSSGRRSFSYLSSASPHVRLRLPLFRRILSPLFSLPLASASSNSSLPLLPSCVLRGTPRGSTKLWRADGRA